jgi:hypothetical protein
MVRPVRSRSIANWAIYSVLFIRFDKKIACSPFTGEKNRNAVSSDVLLATETTRDSADGK